ncbi:MAG TPA: phage protein Gp27 family protein [Azospirillaceae bacterium]|nr:phage protein Gp27 family protein [Azospirillaceae bacterium]
MGNPNIASSVYVRRRQDPERLHAAIDRIIAAGWTTTEAAALLEAAVDWEPPTEGTRPDVMVKLANRLRRMLTVDRIKPTRLLSGLYGIEPGVHTPGKLKRLPPAVRSELERMVEANATVDSMTQRLSELGVSVSKTAAHRFRKRHSARLEHYREAKMVAGAWTDTLGSTAQGQVGRLLQEMLKTVAFQTLAAVGEDGTVPDAKQLAELAKAVREVAAAEQITTELELRLRRELADSLAPKLAAAERAAEGRPDDLKAALARIREEVYGLAPDTRAEP